MKPVENFWKETVGEWKKTFPQNLFYVFLIFLSWVYGIVYFVFRRTRRKLKIRVDANVISVGNVTVGGTGKTQLVEALSQMFLDNTLKFAVLCHGYKAKKKATQPLVNWDGAVKMSLDEAGDEAFYLANKFKGVPVLIGRNRVKNARLLLQKYHADILLLDDAFQYTKLYRDIDIVLVDATNPVGNGRLFPAGILREPLTALSRAGMVILSKANFVQQAAREKIKDEFIRPYTSAPVFEMHVYPDKLRDLFTGEEMTVDMLSHKHVIAFCGIGNPEAFIQTVKQCSPTSVQSYFFPDHHAYVRDDIRRIFDRAVREGHQVIVTTEKDAVKFSVSEKPVVPFFSVKAKVVLIPDLSECKEFEPFLKRHEQIL